MNGSYISEGFRTSSAAGLLLAVVLTLGCGAAKEGAPAPKAGASHAACAAPIKVALLGDKTSSTELSRTQQIQADDLQPLVELISRCGGELALGFVTDDSNRSLVRLRVEVPDAAPEPPKLNGVPPFEAARLQDDYRKKKAEHERRMAKWDEQTARHKARFERNAREWLTKQPGFTSSDVWGALQRAELFIEEAPASWPAAPQRYILLVSDGEDNASRPEVTLSAETQLILVNGSASVGDLQRLNPHRFESLDSATRYIISSEGEKQ